MNLLGAIEKNAALWDKLLQKGLLGVNSVKRLTALAPTDLKGLPPRLLSLSQIPSGLPSASAYLKNFRGLAKLPSNPMPELVSNGFSKMFLRTRNAVRAESMEALNKPDDSMFSSLWSLISAKKKAFQPAFKPNIDRLPSTAPIPTDNYKNWISSVGNARPGPSYDSVPNVLTKFKDPVSTRHELGHFFDFNRMSPQLAARVRQRIITRAQEYYPEMLYKARNSKQPIKMLNEATAQGIAASGKSPAAQRFRQLYNTAPNTGENAMLIERANKIDPSGRDSAVINHLLHNYGLA